MDLVVSITLGSSMQIALFLTPFLVILGWIFDIPMTLSNLVFIVLTSRLRNFPGRRNLHLRHIHRIPDHGWQFKLDGGGHAVGNLQHRRSQLLAVPG